MSKCWGRDIAPTSHTWRVVVILSTISVLIASFTSCSGKRVEMSVKEDSSGEAAEGDGTAKCRSRRPPGVDGSLVAKHENAGEMDGILKKRLQNE
jgi:hypothetical protein